MSKFQKDDRVTGTWWSNFGFITGKFENDKYQVRTNDYGILWCKEDELFPDSSGLKRQMSNTDPTFECLEASAICKQELLDLEQDYKTLEQKYFEVCEGLAVAEAKLSKPNKQQRIIQDRADGSEVYLAAYEEFFGKLPKTLHFALLMVSTYHSMSVVERQERARDLAHAAKKSVSFIDRWKEKLNVSK